MDLSQDQLEKIRSAFTSEAGDIAPSPVWTAVGLAIAGLQPAHAFGTMAETTEPNSTTWTITVITEELVVRVEARTTFTGWRNGSDARPSDPITLTAEGVRIADISSFELSAMRELDAQSKWAATGNYVFKRAGVPVVTLDAAAAKGNALRDDLEQAARFLIDRMGNPAVSALD